MVEMNLNHSYYNSVIRKFLPILFFVALLFSYNANVSAQETQSPALTESSSQIIVQYKKGYTPPEIQEKVEQRQKIASQSIMGSLRIAAEDTISNTFGIPDPDEIQKRYSAAEEESKTIDTKPVLNFKPKYETQIVSTEIITIENGASVSDAIEAYKTLPTVESVSINPIMYANATPNDPLFPQEWALQKIQATTAWDIAKGSNSVNVAVIDSGVQASHPDLLGRVTKQYNAFNNSTSQDDRCGHGTHVAGTIGALTNNAVGVAGVNWNVNIFAVKVLDIDASGKCGSSSNSTINGILKAVDLGADVINMSLGSENRVTCHPVYQEAIDYARQRGVVVIAAAGNTNDNAAYHSPANCNGVIVVGATDQSDKRSIWSAGKASNYGGIVTLSAPGTNIMSTMTPQNIMGSGCQGDSYCYSSGTSMATPHVAGAAALLLSINPNLTHDQIKNILVSSANTITTDLPIGPRLNLLAAVQQASNGQQVTQPPIKTPTTVQVTQSPQGCDPNSTGTSTGEIDFSDLRVIRREIAGLSTANLGSCLTNPSSDPTTFTDLRRVRRIIAGLDTL